MAELLEQIQGLDRRELVALIREAAARLDELENQEGEWELSSAQKAQLDEVRDAYERDGNPGDPWERVRARIVAQAETTTEVAVREKVAA